jgi:hypothetical protein
MDKPYCVSLQGMEGLPAAEKISAEVRFITAIERALGGADAVVEVYRAWREASENEATEVRKETWALATQWAKAFETAQRSGLKNIGEGDAHFELQLARQPADSL